MISADVNGNFTTCNAAHNSASQPFFGVLLSGQTGSTTRYARPTSSVFQTTEEGIPMPVGCTLSLLTLRTDASQPNDGSLVATLRKNGVATSLVVTITATAVAGTFQDAVHTVTFNAGDLWSLQLVNNSASTSPIRSYSFVSNLTQVTSPVSFAPSTPILASDVNANFSGFATGQANTRYVVLGNNHNTPGNYLAPGNEGGAATPTDNEWVVPVAGTLGSFYFNASGAGTDTVYVNGVATALAATATGAGVFSNTGTTVSVSANDRITVLAGVNGGWSFGFVPASVAAFTTFVAGATTHAADMNTNFSNIKTAHNAERIPSFIVNDRSNNTIASGTTVFRGPGLTGAFPTTETLAECVIPIATTARNLVVRTGNSAQPAGGSLVATLRKNQVDTALTVTVNAGAGTYTTVADTTHSVSFAAGDRICLKMVNNAGTAVSAFPNVAALTFDL